MKPLFLSLVLLLFCITPSYAGYFLVWDPDPINSSGPAVNSCLDSLGYSGEYDVSITSHLNRLSDFAEIFIFLGFYPDNFILQEGETIDSLSSYLDNGGQIYMEGDHTWWNDPHTNLHDYFCLQGQPPVQMHLPLKGVGGTFTEGMSFGSSNTFPLPVLSPLGTAFTIFTDDSSKSIGVACDTMPFKTIAFCFPFGSLTDSTPPSRKVDLADSIMHFFGNFAGKKEFKKQTLSSDVQLYISPNPFTSVTSIRLLGVSVKREETLNIYDAAGRLAKSVKLETNTYQLGTELKAGIYFLKLNGKHAGKIVKVR